MEPLFPHVPPRQNKRRFKPNVPTNKRSRRKIAPWSHFIMNRMHILLSPDIWYSSVDFLFIWYSSIIFFYLNLDYSLFILLFLWSWFFIIFYLLNIIIYHTYLLCYYPTFYIIILYAIFIFTIRFKNI